MVAKSIVLLALGLLAPALCAASSSNAQTPLVLPSQRQRYDDHQVWRVDWQNLSKDVKDDIMDAVETLQFDIWRSSAQTLDIALPTSNLHTLLNFLPQNTPVSLFIPSIQDLIDQTPLTPKSVEDAYKDEQGWDVSDLDTPFYDSYQSYEGINSFGDALVDHFDGVLEGFDVGVTYGGRTIRGWRAHIAPEEGEAEAMERKKKKGRKGEGEVIPEQKLEFVVQSGQHAREWVGPATSFYFLHSLLLEATTRPHSEANRLLRAFTFTVVPLINPDGYTYSREHGRLWRKNRQDVGNHMCAGIDLNSNWGYKWTTRKRVVPPCSEAYPGKAAFEAYETRAMANYLQNGTEGDDTEGRRVRAFVDLHSYGQLFMFPFAHSCDDFPPDAEMLMEAGLGVAKAMRTQQGEGYQAGQACDLTYRAPGDAIDYAYGVIDARWSYSAELRDTGTYGFLLPPHLIRPAADEVTAGLMYLAKFIYTLEIAG